MRFVASVISAIAVSSAVAFVPSVPVSMHRSSALCMSSTATDVTGTVKWYNAERGFGFIEVDGGGPDMYVHATGLTFDGPLLEDDRVSFATEIDKRTNKPKAVNVARTDAEAPAPAAEETPTAESMVEKVMEVVKDDLAEDEKAQKSAKAESFQRARLEEQLEQKAAAEKAAAEAAAAEAAAKAEAEEKARAEAEAAAAAAAAKAAEEKAAAEAAAKAEAEAKAKAEAEAAAAAAAAKAAEEKAAAEAKAKAEAEAAAAAAAAAAEEEAAARELGYPSVAIMKARQQPKSAEEEAVLADKYGAMDLEERAFTILADLGMIDLNPDPDDPNRDTSKDDEDME